MACSASKTVKRWWGRGGIPLLALSLTACAAGAASPQATETSQTASASADVTTNPAETSSPSTTESSPESSTSPPLTSSTEEAGVNTPPSDEPLGLNDFFRPSDDWEANRYDIAGRSDVQGIAATVGYCGESYAEEIELRLSNKFASLDFKVGQADNSESSDQDLTVEVLANNEQAEIRAVPFNQVQQFTIDVDSVNAVKIRFYIDSISGGCEGSVIGVLHETTVS